MKPMIVHFLTMAVGLAAALIPTGVWVGDAAARLAEAGTGGAAQAAPVAIAAAADEGYCTRDLKQILRRVLTSCGLVKQGQKGRGCQPLEARSVAAMSGEDFNALFKPLSTRAALVQFEKDKAELDQPAQQLLEKTFAEKRGASYFFVVSRASPEGSVTHNRELSQKRAQAVLDHLKTRFTDPELEQEVGLLTLGEEYAQLSEEFCQWTRSRAADRCGQAELNRSAFIAWIDCRL
jgi:outer membrane protein OmpA-like peptidoglycan-associated protein